MKASTYEISYNTIDSYRSIAGRIEEPLTTKTKKSLSLIGVGGWVILGPRAHPAWSMMWTTRKPAAPKNSRFS